MFVCFKLFLYLNIVNILFRLVFVLNYCVNGELLSFINQREIFDAKAALFYAAEILVALEHLHKNGIVHRFV